MNNSISGNFTAYWKPVPS